MLKVKKKKKTKIKKKVVKKVKSNQPTLTPPVTPKKPQSPRTSLVRTSSTVQVNTTPRDCEECGDEIPLERLQLVDTYSCVPCMERLERRGIGTRRHTMEFSVKSRDEEVEEIELHLRRGN